MNKKSLVKVFLFAMFSTLLLSEGCSIKKNYLNLTNPSDFDRSDELVVLKRSVLERKLGNIPQGKYIALHDKQKNPLIIQFDDLNKDGRWDEAAFLYSFNAHQKVSLAVVVTDKMAAHQTVVRAHVRQRRKNPNDTFGANLEKDSIPAGQLNTDFSKHPLPPFLTEGPAWENDKVGFRIYFDVRNTKDIWGKTTTKMMMDTVGVDPKVIYHHLAGWGMDILAVGESLGAGSLALSIPVKGKDTLVRLGGINMGPVFYEKVADGSIRAIFRMHYPQWKVLDKVSPVDLTEEISIWGGQYFYESKVSINNAPKGAQLVSGIVNLKSKRFETFSTAGSKVFYTYDTQSENNDQLGMAIMGSGSESGDPEKTLNVGTDIKNTYYIPLKISTDKTSDFRFYACWERSDKRFTSASQFRDFLEFEALKYIQPIRVK